MYLRNTTGLLEDAQGPTEVPRLLAEDELVKNAISDYAAEQFEVASYRSLITAAEELGDEETVRACQENLSEDEEMARWLEQQLPAVTQEFLRSKAGEDS